MGIFRWTIGIREIHSYEFENPSHKGLDGHSEAYGAPGIGQYSDCKCMSEYGAF